MEVIAIAPAHNKFHFLEMLFIADVINYSLSSSAPGSPSVYHFARYSTKGITILFNIQRVASNRLSIILNTNSKIHACHSSSMEYHICP